MVTTPHSDNTPRTSAEEGALQASFDAEETIIMDAVHPEGEPKAAEYGGDPTPSGDGFLGEVPADSADEEEVESDKRDNTMAMISAGAIGAIVVITLIFFLVGRSPDTEPDTTAASSTAAPTLPAPTDSNKGFTLPEIQPGDGIKDVNQPAPQPTTHVVTTVVDAPEPAVTPVDSIPGAGENGDNGSYMALNQAPENIQKVGRILQSEIFTSTTMDRSEYDRLADATQPLGFTPDQSFYTAFENLGYLGDAGDLTYASVAENPDVMAALDGTYRLSFPVTSTVMLNEVLDNMGWNQESLQKDLRTQLTDRENFTIINVHLDPAAGTMSTSSTTWWL